MIACHYWGGVLGRFCWGVVADTTPPVDEGSVTVGVTVLADAGSELPADFAEGAAVRVLSLAEAGEVTLGMVGVGNAESVSRADAADGFSVIVAEQITVGESARTAVVPVNMVNVQTDTVGDNRFSPGVGCRVPLGLQNYDDMTYLDDSDCSEDCGYGLPGEFELYDPRDYEAGWERMYADETNDYWLADHLHEEGEFVYVKDAFGPEFAPVALHGEGAADQIEFSISELPDDHRDAAMAPKMLRLCSGLACAPTMHRI